MSRGRVSILAAVSAVLLVALSARADEKPRLDDDALRQIETALKQHDVKKAEALVNRYAIPPSVSPRVLGALRFEQGRFEEAIVHFEKALDDSADSNLTLYLAAALVEVGRPQDALKRLGPDAPLFQESLSARLVVGRALRDDGQRQEAFDVFVGAAKTFSPAPAALVEAIVIAAEAGAVHLAQSLVGELLQTEGATAEHRRLAALALASEPAARPLLEKMVASGAGVDATLALATAYAEAGMPQAAARFFDAAEARAPGRGALFAAEQWAEAGDLKRALRANANVTDDNARLFQRVRLLFSHGEMARVVALERKLLQAKAIDDATKYQLAYAHYRLQQPAKAIEWASMLEHSRTYAGAARAILDALGAVSPAVESGAQ